VRGLLSVVRSRDVERNPSDERFRSKCWLHSFL
jgi:hypothetical protein